jgi:cytoskeletal protein CcmA (bactofilin family)
MLGKKEIKDNDIDSVIGSTVKIEGNFSGKGDVIVEGVVNGSLKTTKNLSVGEGAKITANVASKNALIAGVITGDIHIEDNLEILATAIIEGNIETDTLSIAPGAQLSGNIKTALKKDSVAQKTVPTLETEEKPE